MLAGFLRVQSDSVNMVNAPFLAKERGIEVREVRSEMTKVTWPSRKETLVTTGLVIGMAALAAIFFFLADQIIGVAVRALFVVGS